MSRIIVTLVLVLGAHLISTTTPAVAQSSTPEWVPAEQATIHPGVQTVTDGGGQCTANFVFTDPDGEVYLGQSAHCGSTGGSTETNGCLAGSVPLETHVEVGGASQPGVLVYSSWLAMQAADEQDPNACDFNDLALVRLAPEDRGRVNPSLPFYGGPQGIAPSTTAGETVYTFGNSSLRPGNGSAKSGTARGQDGEGWTHDVFTINLGVPGDSGSGFLNSQGSAFGVLSTLEILPNPGSNGVSNLTRMLSYVLTHDGPAVTMADGTLIFDPDGATVDTATGGDTDGGDPGATTRRLNGLSRIETAVRVSQNGYAADAAGAVVLARADIAADALAGTALASAAGGPVLLTPSDQLHPATAAEINRVLPDGATVYLLGGTSALSPQVEGALADYDVRRLAGASRFETAVEVARAVTASPGQIVLADGLTFADALIAGPAAALRGGVVVLTDGTRNHPAVDGYLSQHAAVEQVTVGAAATAAYPGRTNYVGASDQETSVLVARAYAPQASTVGVARVDAFADALSGGAHAALGGTTLLLTDSGSLTPVVRDHLSQQAATIDTAVLYGGTSALSAEVEEQIRAAIS
ncbi:MAG: cell wall-binding repeat-containing protein [Euzebya sp.]